MKTEQREIVIKQVLDFIEGGLPIGASCEKAGVNHSTFWRWRQEEGWGWIDDKIIDALQQAGDRRMADRAPQVENALITRALGFKEITEEYLMLSSKDGKPILDEQGKQARVLKSRKEKTIAGNVTAQIFLLCNLSKEGYTTINWQNVYDILVGDGQQGSFMDYFRRLANDGNGDNPDDPVKKPLSRAQKGARGKVERVRRRESLRQISGEG